MYSLQSISQRCGACAPRCQTLLNKASHYASWSTGSFEGDNIPSVTSRWLRKISLLWRTLAMDDAQRLEACEDLHRTSRRRGDGSGSASIVSASLRSSPSLESSSTSTKKGASVSCASSGSSPITSTSSSIKPGPMSTSCSAAPACRISGAGRRLYGVNRLPPAWCVCAAASTESHSSAHGKMYFQAASLCASVDISAKVVCSQPKNMRFNSMGERFKTMAASGLWMSEETKWLAAARARPAFNARMQLMSHGCVRACGAKGQERHSHVR